VRTVSRIVSSRKTWPSWISPTRANPGRSGIVGDAP
jgi:hypothetical protein